MEDTLNRIRKLDLDKIEDIEVFREILLELYSSGDKTIISKPDMARAPLNTLRYFKHMEKDPCTFDEAVVTRTEEIEPNRTLLGQWDHIFGHGISHGAYDFAGFYKEFSNDGLSKNSGLNPFTEAGCGLATSANTILQQGVHGILLNFGFPPYSELSRKELATSMEYNLSRDLLINLKRTTGKYCRTALKYLQERVLNFGFKVDFNPDINFSSLERVMATIQRDWVRSPSKQMDMQLVSRLPPEQIRQLFKREVRDVEQINLVLENVIDKYFL